MAAGDYTIALDGKFYYGTAGSQADTETTNVENVKLDLSPQTASVTPRGKTYTTTKPLSLDASLTFDVYDIEEDSFVSSLITAVTGKTSVALFPTDLSTGGAGLDGDFYVTGFTRDETDLTKYNVTCKPTHEDRDPSWTTWTP